MADSGTLDHCHVHGPRNLVHHLMAMKFFMRRKEVILRAKEIDSKRAQRDELPTLVHRDDNVTIRAISIEVYDAPKAQQTLSMGDYPFTRNFKFIEEFRDKDWLTEELQYPWKFRNAPQTAEGQTKQDHIDVIEEEEAMEKIMHESGAVAENGAQNEDVNNSSSSSISSSSSNRVNSPAHKRQKREQSTSNEASTTLLTHFGRWNLELDNSVASRIKAEMQEHGESLPIATKSSVSYICQTADIPGKFDAKKAKELGIKPGPLFGQLSRGSSITTEDGRVISPDMVISPSKPGPIVIMVYCPSMDFVDALIEHPHWKPYFARSDKTHLKVSCVIHSTPADIVETGKYMQFMQHFGGDCQHVIINKQYCSPRVVFQSSTMLHCKLNLIDEKVFPLPHFSNSPARQIVKSKQFKMVAGDNLLKFHLSPTNQLDASAVTKELSVHALQQETLQNSDIIKKLIDEYKSLASGKSANDVNGHSVDLPQDASGYSPDHVRILKDMHENDASLVFLGTGSACPSKYRNVSSTYLHLFEHGGLLMDCGEGTYGQLYRMYGPQRIDDVLLNLKCIWVSHSHADHHLGLCKILSQRARIMKTRNIDPADERYRVIILAYEFIKAYIDCYNLSFSDETYVYDYVDCRATQSAGHTLLNRVCTALNLQHLHTVHVDHSCEAYGLIVKHNHGWKLVHSGDTRPCNALIEAGRDATVLVHEATFEDAMTNEAIAKKHSTTKEAIECGIKMRAYRIILTHFSQRYPKIPVFDKSFTGITSIAFDMTDVNFKHLGHLPKVLSPVQEVFREELEEMTKEVKSVTVDI